MLKLPHQEILHNLATNTQATLKYKISLSIKAWSLITINNSALKALASIKIKTKLAAVTLTAAEKSLNLIVKEICKNWLRYLRHKYLRVKNTSNLEKFSLVIRITKRP